MLHSVENTLPRRVIDHDTVAALTIWDIKKRSFGLSSTLI